VSLSRREFIKSVGIALASLLLSRCARFKDGEDKVEPTEIAVTCYEIEAPITVEVTPTMLVQQTKVLSDVIEGGGVNPEATRLAQMASSREMVRALWLQLYILAASSSEDADEGKALQTLMVERHRSALDDLMALEVLSEPVADQVQVAFEEESFHAWRDNAPITCYEGLPLAYEPRGDLLQQANLLNGFEGELDAETIELAREAVARDITFLKAFESENPSTKLLALWQSGEIDAGEDAIAATQFLVELLLEE
jgi:hypothetical protein